MGFALRRKMFYTFVSSFFIQTIKWIFISDKIGFQNYQYYTQELRRRNTLLGNKAERERQITPAKKLHRELASQQLSMYICPSVYRDYIYLYIHTNVPE